MSKYIGEYKAYGMMMFGENGFIEKSFDEIDDPDLESVKTGIVKVKADGKIYCTFEMPEGVSEEELKAAIEDGLQLDGDRIIDGIFDWKEENGDLYYFENSGATILGETVDPWTKINQDDETIVISFGIYKKIK